MNRLLCAVSVLALVIPGAASAQRQDDQHHGGGKHAQQGRNGGGRGHAQQAQSPQGRPTAAREQARPAVQTTTTYNRVSQQGRTSVAQRSTMQPVRERQSGSRSGNVRRVRAPEYRYPSGYSYRRWSTGLILPSIFLSNSYFYNDWAAVGAYPPPRGYVWVRYGPDLLLVSRRSGRIRDVIYGAFY